MTAVQLINLTKQFGAVTAVDKLSLTVGDSELVALLGPSGCGKTTTMRMVAGLLSPTSGDIHFAGRSVLTIPPERRGAVMVFQKHLLFPYLSVGENVAFGLQMRGTPRQEIRRRVGEMLSLVQLPGYETRRPHELSGGQQQRVALARALVIEPQLLLLDEPLANLDANLRLEMRKLIRTIQQTLHITMIFVTHDQEEAVMLADRVALMEHGRLLQFDSPRAFYERPQSATVARFFRNENFLAGHKHGDQVETALGSFGVRSDNPQPDGPVWLTVRPEHIAFDPAHSNNCLQANVLSTVYLGAYTQVQLQVADQRWTVHLADGAAPITAGQWVTLHLPAAHCWCVPEESVKGDA
jgi:ABC-type Fe3+/spermidine/putrescine transport system ATPase subunit